MTQNELNELKSKVSVYMANKLFGNKYFHKYIVELYGGLDGTITYCDWLVSRKDIDASMDSHQITNYLCQYLFGTIRLELSRYTDAKIYYYKEGGKTMHRRNMLNFCGFEDTTQEMEKKGYGEDWCLEDVLSECNPFVENADRQQILEDVWKTLKELDDKRPFQQKLSYVDCMEKMIKHHFNSAECARLYGSTRENWNDIKRRIMGKISPIIRDKYPSYVVGDSFLPSCK